MANTRHWLPIDTQSTEQPESEYNGNIEQQHNIWRLIRRTNSVKDRWETDPIGTIDWIVP